MEGLLDEVGLAKFLKVSFTTLWRLRKAGMPYMRVGGSVRYNLRSVLDWLEEKERKVI